jgi:hypothetical protein
LYLHIVLTTLYKLIVFMYTAPYHKQTRILSDSKTVGFKNPQQKIQIQTQMKTQKCTRKERK